MPDLKPPVATNRKARHDYFLQDKLEAGISLRGSEVKAIREGRVNLKDSYVRIMNSEAFLLGCHISPYSKIQGYGDPDPARTRKLLLKRDEIDKLEAASKQKGFAILALSIYFKRGLVKVEIALGKGKKEYDKRETIKRRMHDRESAAAIKHHLKKGKS